MELDHKTHISLTPLERATTLISLKNLGREVRIAEQSLCKMRERYLDVFIPALVNLLDKEYEKYEGDPFGGGVNRFDTAYAFTNAGMKMDFRLAEALLAYATKKGKAYLIVEGGSDGDAYFGTKKLYEKYASIDQKN